MSMKPTSADTTELAPEAPQTDAAKSESFGLLSELRNTGSPMSDGSPKPKQKLSTTTVIIMLVVAGSGALLFGMRKIGTSSGSSGAGVQIEYTRDETVTAAMQDKVLHQLASSTTPLQVPADQLNLESKNPFMLPVSKVGSVVTLSEDPEAIERAKALAKIAAHKQDVETKLAEIHLQGVMQGKIPLARVDGVTVRAGDMVNELFEVKSINERSMTLTCDGKDYEIVMPDPGSENAAKKNNKSPVKTTPKKK